MTKDNAAKLDRLYALYEQPMFRIALGVLKNETAAEDAVSDAFMRIIGKIGSIGEPDSPKTKAYIIKTIKSTAIDAYRKNRRAYEKNQPLDEQVMAIPDSSADVEKLIFDTGGTELLSGLNEADRELVLLRCRDELPWEQVAERVGMTAANARKRFERTRKKLLKMKGDADYEKQISK